MIHGLFAIDGCFAGTTTRYLVILSFCFLTDFAALGIFGSRVNRHCEPYYALHTTFRAVSLLVRVNCVRCYSFLKDCLTVCQSITLAPNALVVSDLCILPLPLLCCPPCLYVPAAACLCVSICFVFPSLFLLFFVLYCFLYFSSLFFFISSFVALSLSYCSLLSYFFLELIC